MPKKESDLFQARIGNMKNKIFIEEYIKITQAKLEQELGLSFCPKGLALYHLLKENAGHNGAMKGGRLVPEYYHKTWIDERIEDFKRGLEGYSFQLNYLNKLIPDIMKREQDIDDYNQWDAISDIKKALEFCYVYFTKKLMPRVEEFNEKYVMEHENEES